MSASRVIELRQMLSEKFPKFRGHTLQSAENLRNFWQTGLPQIDGQCLGLARSAITEIVAENGHCGSATLIGALVQHAAHENKIITVIDGADSLDVTQIDEAALSKMLWVRCRSAEQAMQAADLILRDNNLSLVFLDLVPLPARQLRRISPTAWHRFQRLLENAPSVCAVFTPHAMIPPAAVRLTLRAGFNFAALEKSQADLLPELDVAVTKNLYSVEGLNLEA